MAIAGLYCESLILVWAKMSGRQSRERREENSDRVPAASQEQRALQQHEIDDLCDCNGCQIAWKLQHWDMCRIRYSPCSEASIEAVRTFFPSFSMAARFSCIGRSFTCMVASKQESSNGAVIRGKDGSAAGRLDCLQNILVMDASRRHRLSHGFIRVIVARASL